MLICILKQNSYVVCEIAFTKITYHGPVKSCFWWKMFQLGNTIPTPCLGSFKQSINIYTTEITFVGIHLILFDLMSVLFFRICINYLSVWEKSLCLNTMLFHLSVFIRFCTIRACSWHQIDGGLRGFNTKHEAAYAHGQLHFTVFTSALSTCKGT